MPLGKVPHKLGPGETIHIYGDGEPGPGGTVGNKKINKNNPDRHFSIRYLKTVKTKIVDGEITDQHGKPISAIRRYYDIERAPRKTIRENMSFKQYLEEKSLHVYDIDDTLLHTNALIHVKDHTGKTVRKLTNQEFNDHKLEKGHTYDFSEFRDSEKFNKESKPMHGMLQQLKRVHQKIKLGLNKGSKVVFNTARADFDDKHKFLDTFRKHGVDIDNIHVHRAGNIPGNAPPAEKKLHYIRQHLDSHGYNEVHMHDDSKTNLKAFLQLRGEYPGTRFHAWHVGHDGEIRKFMGR